jgi:hypothetical protein
LGQDTEMNLRNFVMARAKEVIKKQHNIRVMSKRHGAN